MAGRGPDPAASCAGTCPVPVNHFCQVHIPTCSSFPDILSFSRGTCPNSLLFDLFYWLAVKKDCFSTDSRRKHRYGNRDTYLRSCDYMWHSPYPVQRNFMTAQVICESKFSLRDLNVHFHYCWCDVARFTDIKI